MCYHFYRKGLDIMDEKHHKITLIMIVLFAIISGSLFYLRTFLNNEEESIEIKTTKKVQLEKLKDDIKVSEDFKNSNIKIDEEKNSIIIDDLYEVTIKNNYYVMNIKNSKQEETYCKIVDAIEQSKGQEPKKTKETCEKTLKGIINMPGLSAEIYDSNKTLLLNIENKMAIYDISSSHVERDLIKDDEINYNIKIDDFAFTSMSINYIENGKTYSIRGNVFNTKNKKNQKFLFKIYDVEKKVIAEKEYVYENDTKKYIQFSVDIPNEQKNAKYYSIEKR